MQCLKTLTHFLPKVKYGDVPALWACGQSRKIENSLNSCT